LANGFLSVKGLVAYKRPFRVVGAEELWQSSSRGVKGQNAIAISMNDQGWHINVG
jgi:hypothetical protein